MDNITNNLGDLFKEQVKHSKTGTKIAKMETQIATGKMILDTIKMEDSVEDAKRKAESMLKELYKGHHLTKQMGYLSNKRTTLDVITQAFNTMLMKTNSLEKAQIALKEEVDGF